MDPAALVYLTAASATAGLHALIPDHWLPFVLMGRSRHWSVAKTLALASASGALHVGWVVEGPKRSRITSGRHWKCSPPPRWPSSDSCTVRDRGSGNGDTIPSREIPERLSSATPKGTIIMATCSSAGSRET